MGDLLYLAGPPAVGKSTLAAALFGPPTSSAARPVAHRVVGRAVILGAERDGFPGTDTLGMAALPIVDAWLRSDDAPPFVFGEGDRLASAKWFGELRSAGWSVTLVVMLCSPASLADRRAERALNGWLPKAPWLKGRDTKSYRLAEVADLVLDGDRPTADLAADLAGHPVVRAGRLA